MYDYNDKRIPCEREGCPKIVPRHRRDRQSSCSFMCDATVRELAQAERVSTATGDGDHWALAVALSDALTAYRASETRMYLVARDSGMSNSRWDAPKRGS